MTRRKAVRAGAVAALLSVVVACGNAEDVARSGSGSTSGSAPSDSPSTPSTSTPPTTSSGGLPQGFGAGPPGSGLPRFTNQTVAWQPCGSDQCARVWVPLDYRKPDGQAITLAMRKRPASGNKIGTLFLNPGGPGASAQSFVDDLPFKPSVRAAYDIVGVDPRGVGESTPIDCVSDRELDAYIASDPTPDTKAEIQQNAVIWKRFTDGCVRRSGPLLRHVSTVEVAKDFDVLRQLVGDQKFNYVGFSYGTYIGATYAGEFPKNVGRMVLDGAVDPTESPLARALSSAKGFDIALDAFLQNCVDRGCPLGTSVDSIKTRIQTMFADLDAKPLPVGSRALTEGEALLGVWLPLYSKSYWPAGQSALQTAFNGDGSTLLALADVYVDRRSNGSYDGNSDEAQPAISCLDNPEHESAAQILRLRPRFLKVSPTFGPSAAWFAYACSHWPVKAEFKKPDVHAKGAPPIVVIGTTRDPATPYQNSVDLAKLLDSGVLLSRDGDGHTGYLLAGNACVDNTVDAFLLNDDVPRNDKRC